MNITALLLSRLQFAFTVSVHLILPLFTIGLAAWVTVQESFRLATATPAYRVLSEFWLKISQVAFAFGGISGTVTTPEARQQLARTV
jgi:cytochrome d ubiquinol oxidase subunit I